MKRYDFLFIILFSFLLLTTSSRAQGPTPLNNLTVKLWPEFDDPRLLVIFDGELTQPDQPFSVPIPANATINAVASAGSDGRLVNSVWELGTGADGSNIITVTPDGPLFRIEYYISLNVQGEQRVIDFKLPAGYFVTDEAGIEVLLPPDSTDISLDPPEDTNQQTAEGGIFLGRSLGDVAADQAIIQKVSYRNPTGALTMPETPKEPMPSAPAPTPAPTAGNEGPDPLLLGLGLAAVILIALGAYGLWRTRDTALEAGPSAPAPRSRTTAKMSVTPRGKDRFCRNCGAPFDPEDRYCRHCGTKRL